PRVSVATLLFSGARRLLAHHGGRIPVGDLDAIDWALDEPFDVFQQLDLRIVHEGQCGTGAARAAGPADTVHVVFGHIGQFKVHDLRQLVNVQTTCGDIGGHQYGDLAIF